MDSNNIFETSKPGKGKYRKGRMRQGSPGHASNDNNSNSNNNSNKDGDGDAKAPAVVVDVPAVVVDVPADVADPKGERGLFFPHVFFFPTFPAPRANDIDKSSPQESIRRLARRRARRSWLWDSRHPSSTTPHFSRMGL